MCAVLNNAVRFKEARSEKHERNYLRALVDLTEHEVEKAAD